MKLEDLPDAALDRATTSVHADRQQAREVQTFLDQIADLLAMEREFGRETLEGIAESVERSGRVTEGQQRAVGNIERALIAPRRRRW